MFATQLSFISSDLDKSILDEYEVIGTEVFLKGKAFVRADFSNRHEGDIILYTYSNEGPFGNEINIL